MYKAMQFVAGARVQARTFRLTSQMATQVNMGKCGGGEEEEEEEEKKNEKTRRTKDKKEREKGRR